MAPRPAPAHPDLSAAAKRLAIALFLLVSIAVIGSAFSLMAESLGEIFEGDEALDALGRLSALLAVAFLFLEVMTGSFRPLLGRALRPKRLQQIHITLGLAGLGFALMHFFFMLPEIDELYEESNRLFFIFGPVVLVVLILTIASALLRSRLRKSWAWLSHSPPLTASFLVIYDRVDCLMPLSPEASPRSSPGPGQTAPVLW